MEGSSASSRLAIRSSAMPADTSPTMRPSAARSGTLPRAERPSVPVSIAVTVCPERAGAGSVLTRWPIWAGLGWE
jgi:hypothetical protein